MKKTLLRMALAVTLLTGTAISSQATAMFALTNNNTLVTISDPNTPSVIGGPYSIAGIVGNQQLVAIDARPDNGVLYALGYDPTYAVGQVYSLVSSGTGTGFIATALSTFAIPLNLGDAKSVGFDFISPLQNQLRVTAANGASYVLSAVDGSILNTATSAVTYAIGDLNLGLNAAIGAIAFTNSFVAADGTTAFGYDVNSNTVVSFDPATFTNNYNFIPNIIHTVGLSGLLPNLLTGSIGMDAIYDAVNHVNNVFMSATPLLSSGSALYAVNTTTGLVQNLGLIGNGTLNIRDIAGAIDPAVITPVTGQLVAALTYNLRNLIFFDSDRPGIIRNKLPITGVTQGQRIIALDYALDGLLYGFGYNSIDKVYQLYKIDQLSGLATALNPIVNTLDLGSDNGSGDAIDVAFSLIPTATNLFRVIGNNGATNVQISALTGGIIHVDNAIQYNAGDLNFGATVNLGSIAYTNDEVNALASSLVGYDFNTGALVNFATGVAGDNGVSGILNSLPLNLGSILNIFQNNSTYTNGYVDIHFDANLNINKGFFATNFLGLSNLSTNYSTFYPLDLLNLSLPTVAGSIGLGLPVKDIATQILPITSAVGNVANSNSTNTLSTYPNPVTGATSITLPTAATGNVQVLLVTMDGRVAQSYQYAAGTTKLDMNMSQLPTGIYMARVSQNGNTQSIKIVKN